MNLIEFLSFLIIFLTFTFLGLFLFKIVSSQFMLEERFFMIAFPVIIILAFCCSYFYCF